MRARVAMPLLVVAVAILGGIALLVRRAPSAPAATPANEGPARDVPPEAPISEGTRSLARQLAGAGDMDCARLAASTGVVAAADLDGLIALLSSGGPAARSAALVILARQKDPDGRILEALRRTVGDPDLDLALDAIGCLRAYADLNPERGRQATLTLLDCTLPHQSRDMRMAATDALVFDRLEAADHEGVGRLLADTEPQMRLAAADCVGGARTSRREALRLLTQAFRVEPFVPVKARLADAVAGLGDPAALAGLKGASPDLDAQIDRLLRRLAERE